MMNWINVLFPLLELATAISTGILAGALLTEANVLVPYWRKMDAKNFLALHHQMGPALFRFFAPITIAGTMLPAIAWIAAYVFGSAGSGWWAVSAFLGIVMLAIYFMYFKGANESFETGSLTEEQLPDELARWAFWHNLRTTFAVVSAIAALLAVAA